MTPVTWRDVLLAAASGPDFPSGNRYDRFAEVGGRLFPAKELAARAAAVAPTDFHSGNGMKALHELGITLLEREERGSDTTVPMAFTPAGLPLGKYRDGTPRSERT